MLRNTTSSAIGGTGRPLLFFTTAPAASHAQDWTGQVTLYGWGAGVGGDLTPFTGAPTLSFDKSLTEVLKDLDAAFFATGFARRGDFVVFGDFTYSSSIPERLDPRGTGWGRWWHYSPSLTLAQ